MKTRSECFCGQSLVRKGAIFTVVVCFVYPIVSYSGNVGIVEKKNLVMEISWNRGIVIRAILGIYE